VPFIVIFGTLSFPGSPRRVDRQNVLQLCSTKVDAQCNTLTGSWPTSPAGWLPRTGISSGTLRSAIEYGLPLPFYCVDCIEMLKKSLTTALVLSYNFALYFTLSTSIAVASSYNKSTTNRSNGVWTIEWPMTRFFCAIAYSSCCGRWE